jgi:hypothetical protein
MRSLSNDIYKNKFFCESHLIIPNKCPQIRPRFEAGHKPFKPTREKLYDVSSSFSECERNNVPLAHLHVCGSSTKVGTSLRMRPELRKAGQKPSRCGSCEATHQIQATL